PEALENCVLDGSAGTRGGLAREGMTAAPGGRVGAGKAYADALERPEPGSGRLDLVGELESGCDPLLPGSIRRKDAVTGPNDLVAGIDHRDVDRRMCKIHPEVLAGARIQRDQLGRTPRSPSGRRIGRDHSK